MFLMYVLYLCSLVSSLLPSLCEFVVGLGVVVCG